MAEKQQPVKGKQQRKLLKKRFFAVGIVIAILLFISITFFTGFLEFFENRLLDFRFVFFNQEKKPSQEIVYIDIDDASLLSLSNIIGGWPWLRGSVVGGLVIDYVGSSEPTGFLFDILYTEESPKEIGAGLSDEDIYLGEFSSFYPSVSHAALFSDVDEDSADMKNKDTIIDFDYQGFKIDVNDTESLVEFPEFNTVYLPYDYLNERALNIHSVTHIEDADGINRKSMVLLKYEGAYYPSLSLKALILHLGADNFVLKGYNLQFTSNDGKLYTVPLTKEGFLQLNYYMDFNDFISYPADNVILSAYEYSDGISEENLAVPPAALRDKIIIIGASAIGLKDIKVTPMGTNVAGPYTHINAISNILENHYVVPVHPVVSYIIILLSVLLLAGITMFIDNTIFRNLFGAGYIVLFLLIALLSFKYGGLVFEMSNTLIAIIFTYLGSVIYVSFIEASEKNKISSAMSKYISPDVMEEVLKQDELIGEVGQELELAILFSDVRGFTTISENYPAAVVVDILNKYLKPMVDIIFENKGTLDKFIGDAIMAFWGAPQQDIPKDKLAVETALKMHRELAKVNAVRDVETEPEFRIGIGINTGKMIVGNIGSEKRLDYTVIGDNVNLGSRMEGLTKYYKVPIIVSELTRNNTSDDFIYCFIDKVEVKGKAKGVKMFVPLAERTEENIEKYRDEVNMFNNAHRLYLERNFVSAKEEFAKLIDVLPNLGALSGVFVNHSQYWIDNPPSKDWDGSWKMLSK